MHLLPREQDKLLILNAAGVLAQRRLARGVRLNTTEATALIATVLQELIRDGTGHTVASLMALGRNMLGTRQVQPCVPSQIHEVMVEGTFTDGTFLVTVHEPICKPDGDLALALYGSFFPVPDLSIFSTSSKEEEQLALSTYIPPGQVAVSKSKGAIVLNAGRQRTRLRVTNMGDRPVQVGSHYHFSETNKQLSFDRGLALGKRLDIAAGTAVRFEPGEAKTVTLVPIGGKQIVTGGNNLFKQAFGAAQSLRSLDTSTVTDQFVNKAIELGFSHVAQPSQPSSASPVEPFEMSREAYSAIYGPTVGDRIRLGDTALWIQVEKDLTSYGDECKFGGGKVLREGMGQATGRPDSETLDLVVVNALIVDWSGIYKADIGVKNGFIVGIGKAGNPDVMDGVTEGMVVGANTEVIAAEKNIVTAGAIDAHVHCESLASRQIGYETTDLMPLSRYLPSARDRSSSKRDYNSCWRRVRLTWSILQARQC